MRILIYSMNYHPEQTGIGKYSGEMAAWLIQQGHEVHVVCAPPYYPSWSIYPGYSSWKYTMRVEHGVQVYRTPLWVPSRPSGVSRLTHLITFAIGSLPVMLYHAFRRPDIVFTVAPAFVCAPTGWLTARLCGAKAWLHVQDFEVDVAFRMGLLKGNLAMSAARWVESKVLRRFDVISTISESMLNLLMRKKVEAERTVLLPNWVDITAISVLDERSSYRDELGISDSKKVALFSGSLGSKQGLMVIPEAAKLLANNDEILFVICGDGVMKNEIEIAVRDLPNVRMLPLQPYERLSELLGMADVHLLPQSPEAEDLVLPSKLTGMLASGRPIIATCRKDTEIGHVVSRCGTVCPPEDAPALANAILHLLSRSEEERRGLGLAARQIAVESLGKESILEGFQASASEPCQIKAQLKS